MDDNKDMSTRDMKVVAERTKDRKAFVIPVIKKHDELPTITAGSINIVRVHPFHRTTYY